MVSEARDRRRATAGAQANVSARVGEGLEAFGRRVLSVSHYYTIFDSSSLCFAWCGVCGDVESRRDEGAVAS